MRVGVRAFGWLLPAVLAIAWPAASFAQSDAIDPEALRLLRRSTEHIAAMKQFRVDASSSIEVVLETSQKIQLDQRSALTVRRPNKLRAERLGEVSDQVLYYDGKSLTVSLPREGAFATLPAPATIEATLDFARDQLGIVAPASDLIHQDAYELLSTGLTSAMIVGDAIVGGVRCDHLAFRNPEVDWQIFIQQGDKPLPRKFVVTSKKMPQSPSFTVELSKWDSAPRVNDAMFRFAPDKAPKKLEFHQGGGGATK
jgi:hypothetical protein